MKQEQVRRDNRTLKSIFPTEGEMRGFLKLALNNLTYFLSSPSMIILSTSGCLLHLSSLLVPVLTLQTLLSEAWYLLATAKFNLGTEPLGILYTCSDDDTVIIWTTGLGRGQKVVPTSLKSERKEYRHEHFLWILFLRWQWKEMSWWIGMWVILSTNEASLSPVLFY